MRPPVRVALVAAVLPLLSLLVAPAPAGASAPPGAALGGYTPLTPSRALDTRPSKAPLGPGATREVQVGGLGGVPLQGVSAVAVTLTAVRPTATTALTAYRPGSVRPATVDLNVVAGRILAEAAVVPVDSRGRIAVRNAAGSTHLLVDVSGWYGTDPSAGVRYAPRTPSRLLDSRTTQKFSGGETRRLQVLPPGSPEIGAALSVLVTGPTGEGHATIHPAGQTRPRVSNINFRSGQTVANLAVVRLVDGAVDIYTSTSTHVVVDLVGTYGGRANGRFSPVPAARVVDSRTGLGLPGAARLQHDQSVTVDVTGVGGVPEGLPGAVAVAVTVLRPGRSGHLTVYPAGAPRPLASNINTTAGETITGLVLAKVDPAGRITIHTRTDTADLVVDVVGFYDRPAFHFPLDGIGGDKRATDNQPDQADVVVSPDDRTAYVTDAVHQSVHAVNLTTGALREGFVGRNPTGIELSPDGRTLYVSESGDGTIAVLDAATLSVARRFSVTSPGSWDYPYAIAVSPDGRTAFVTISFSGSGYGGRLEAYDLDSGLRLPRADLDDIGPITDDADFARSRDHSVITATAGNDGGLVLQWRAGDETWRAVAAEFNRETSHVATSDDGHIVLTSGAQYDTLWVRQDAGGWMSTSYLGDGAAVELTSDGASAYRTTQNGLLELFDPRTGAVGDRVFTEDTFEWYGYLNNHRLVRTWSGKALIALGREGVTLVRL